MKILHYFRELLGTLKLIENHLAELRECVRSEHKGCIEYKRIETKPPPY